MVCSLRCASRLWAVALFMSLVAFTSGHAFAQAVAEKEDAAATEDLPNGKEIYDRYVEATGGRDKMADVNTSKIVGSMEVSGMKAPLTILRARPDKMIVKMELAGMGAVNQGTNGEYAWDVNPMRGSRLLDGTERDELVRRADFDEESNAEKYYKSMDTVGKEDVDGKSCYVVDFTDKDGNVERRYFDAESNLVVKVESERDTPFGKVKVESRLRDYRDIEGMKMPYRNEMSVMGQTQVITFDTVEMNADLEDNAFDPPESVAKLIEKKKSKESEG